MMNLAAVAVVQAMMRDPETGLLIGGAISLVDPSKPYAGLLFGTRIVDVQSGAIELTVKGQTIGQSLDEKFPCNIAQLDDVTDLLQRFSESLTEIVTGLQQTLSELREAIEPDNNDSDADGA